MWQTVNSLLGEKKTTAAPVFTANDYHDYIGKKIADIHVATSHASEPSFVVNDTAISLCVFRRITVDDDTAISLCVFRRITVDDDTVISLCVFRRITVDDVVATIRESPPKQ